MAPRTETQRQRVLRLLITHPKGVCVNTFVYDLDPGIPRVAARVHDLRNDGWEIDTEVCDLHRHVVDGKKTGTRKYVLTTYLLPREGGEEL